ncbi:MAG TPA: M48 family metalloprotease [Candidatus Angelobacter sp.]|nr:M48 family metalloprotease [Candidatus Angelobacter sp.]
MKSRAFFLSLILALGVCLPIPVLASDDQKQTPASDDKKQSSADQNQTTSAPATSNPASANDQTPAASGQNQAPAADQDSTAASQNQSSTDQDQPGDSKKKIKHDGSKNDVEAVGNRKVGGMDWYSIEKEVRMGKEYALQIEQSMKLVQDPVINEYVNRIGQNLVRNSDAKVPFTIKVVDSDEVNAFALPGGFFYVNSGLILAADEEAELAGVMSHEIAHVAARHATRQMTRAEVANIMTIPLIFVGGGVGYLARQVAGIGLPLTFLSFSRGFEAEADYLGLQYMYKAGYDPNAFVAFFEKLEAQEKKKPGTLGKAFSTHPQTPDRIEKSQEEIAKILPARDQYIVSTSEFDQVKARLAAIENRHHVDDDKTNKPTLRRTAGNTSKDGKDSGNGNGDDRPTLKRRDQ